MQIVDAMRGTVRVGDNDIDGVALGVASDASICTAVVRCDSALPYSHSLQLATFGFAKRGE